LPHLTAPLFLAARHAALMLIRLCTLFNFSRDETRQRAAEFPASEVLLKQRQILCHPFQMKIRTPLYFVVSGSALLDDGNVSIKPSRILEWRKYFVNELIGERAFRVYLIASHNTLRCTKVSLQQQFGDFFPLASSVFVLESIYGLADHYKGIFCILNRTSMTRHFHRKDREK
jgi:hypothetical protein